MREQDLNYDSNLVAWWKQLIVGRVVWGGSISSSTPRIAPSFVSP